MASVLFHDFIGQAGGIHDIFIDNVSQTAARVLTAIPEEQPSFDQQCELISVYYILKGSQHGPSGGAGTLQLHVVTQNKQGGEFGLHPPFLFYKVLLADL
jgi:hypothetical protein